MPVVRYEADAGPSRSRGEIGSHHRRADADLPCPALIDAGQRAQELALPFALDARQSDDFTGIYAEIDLAEPSPAQTADIENRRTDRLCFGRENLAKRATGNHGDDLASFE